MGDNAYCFAIWFSNSRTVVWMANHDQPINGKHSKLTLLKNGNLILTDANKLNVGPQTLSHSPLSNYFSTTPVTLFYVTMKVLFCGKAFTSLQIPFSLNNYSLETQSFSLQEARPTFAPVSMSFYSKTITFFTLFIIVLMFPVFIGLLHGLV